LGERLLCKQEVTGSIPVSSTKPAGTENRSICPMLGVNTAPSSFLLTVTRKVVLAPIIGQVRRAPIIQLHLTLNESCKGKTGSHDEFIAAQAAQAWRQAVGRYLTTE
jgi:hypothetical protein